MRRKRRGRGEEEEEGEEEGEEEDGDENDDIMSDINGAKAVQKAKQKWVKDESTKGKEGRSALLLAARTKAGAEISPSTGSLAAKGASPSSPSGGLSAMSTTERGRSVSLLLP